MSPALAALAVHDLKNALGILEARLCALELNPDRALAREAHLHCAQLRQQFVTFLALYGAEGEMRAQSTDESPPDFLAWIESVAVAPDGGATLRLGPCEQAPAFWYFDRRLVRMAMESALHNAWRFARSEIVIDARQSGRFLVLSVEDDGPGLGAVDPSDMSTGLGTELCLSVAKAHCSGGLEGEVKLFNRPEGGASFELWLP